MTARLNCFPAVISISSSPCHMTLIQLYYATKRSPCKYSLTLSVKHCRHLLKTPNGDLKVDSASFQCFTRGLRPWWIISISTVWFLQGPYPLKKTDRYRPKSHSSLGSNLWQKPLESAIWKTFKQPIKIKLSFSQVIQRTLPTKKSFSNSYHPF